MPTFHPTLYLFSGKPGAGKSTLAAKLARENDAVLISADDWLGKLFADEITTLRDHMRRSERLRRVVGPHVTGLLNAGVSVALDFPGNTKRARRWQRSILDGTEAHHVMHVLECTDDECLARLRKRNLAGNHPFQSTERRFRVAANRFVPPSDDEGFNLVKHGAAPDGQP